MQFLHYFLGGLETYLVFRAEKKGVSFLAVGVSRAVLFAFALHAVEEFLEGKGLL